MVVTTITSELPKEVNCDIGIGIWLGLKEPEKEDGEDVNKSSSVSFSHAEHLTFLNMHQFLQ